MGEGKRRREAAAAGKYREPELVTLTVVVRLRRLARGLEIRLEPVGEPWSFPPGTAACGEFAFPFHPSDDGLVFPIRVWLVDIDDPRPPPQIEVDDVRKEVERARAARRATSERT